MPYNLRENVNQFKKAGMGAFDFILGYNFYRIIKSKLHEMIPFMEQEELDLFLTRIEANKNSLMDLDRNAIQPFFGFKSPKEYYDYTEAVGKLHHLKIPTFFLNVQDDPFIDPKLYPVKEIEANENLIFGITKRGGHCSHITGGLRPY